MISIKTEHEIEIMRKAGEITAGCSQAGRRDGKAWHEQRRRLTELFTITSYLKERLRRSLDYGGFPGSACISVNDVVIHGIPGKQVIHEGDIVSVDVGAYWGGFHGDCAATFICGETDDV